MTQEGVPAVVCRVRWSGRLRNVEPRRQEVGRGSRKFGCEGNCVGPPGAFSRRAEEIRRKFVLRFSIYRGILTGYNKAFLVDDTQRNRLITEDPKSADILKPILRGRDIQRYRANWARMWLVSTLPSLNIDIDDYPAVKRHLLSYGRERLEQTGTWLPSGRRSRKRTPHRWFELQDTCAYHAEFGAPKLLWIELAERGRFAYDDTGTLAEASAFMLTGAPAKYLCGILNSRVVQWFLQHSAPTSGMGALRWKKAYLLQLPIPDEDLGRRQRLIRLVDRVGLPRFHGRLVFGVDGV